MSGGDKSCHIISWLTPFRPCFSTVIYVGTLVAEYEVVFNSQT